MISQFLGPRRSQSVLTRLVTSCREGLSTRSSQCCASRGLLKSFLSLLACSSLAGPHSFSPTRMANKDTSTCRYYFTLSLLSLGISLPKRQFLFLFYFLYDVSSKGQVLSVWWSLASSCTCQVSIASLSLREKRHNKRFEYHDTKVYSIHRLTCAAKKAPRPMVYR